ncbi:ABC transporter ATP-binding protein [Candidatus Aminicenantes bacterium AC-708-M15]|nr:ABC transporter ATP-binding protein [SCandidatus Aminicenantes bacterium Aminicenantia_JdfR_composite]MCP2604247.1 ABC transporter ATP-binding protein [Candidatus Aminicenantes bacterium AC-708-M15]MCP2606452.1 ABC transporter ATP-binding protein [Candidatus Aminicenantes bacterium AC-708-I09]MCP2618158.1 ABC transporter ATP-binding protein [Candidatus Aminicenantes bacterium AC-335-A11]
MIILKTVNLFKRFNQIIAINNINLEIEKGKIIGIIGPDGAGKSTLLRLLAGLLKPTSGSVIFKEIEIAKFPSKIKEKIGYMPQHFSLYGDLTVFENLKFFADLYQISREKFKKKVEELLNFSRLKAFKNTLARNLSGGMQKKLALACSLFHTPEILLLDEPTTGVDPISRKELWQLLYQLNNQGVTILFTTPYMDEAQKCQKVGLIHEGQLLAYENPEKLIKEMKEEIIELITEEKEIRTKLKNWPELKNIYPYGDTLHLVFKAGKVKIEEIKNRLENQKIAIKSIRKITPSFEDVFFSLIQKIKTEN